ncbi:putative N-acetylmannosaminyltransferase [compost metagenome]
MKIQLLNFPISTGSYNSFIDQLEKRVKSQTSSYVCVANVHMLVEAHKDPDFSAIINNADMVTPDGVPLTWGIRLLHGIKQVRVAGMDLLPDLLRLSEVENIPVFFYGGTQEMLGLTEDFLQENYPNLIIAGMISPPFSWCLLP